MAKSAVDVAPVAPWLSRRALAVAGRRLTRGHAMPLALLLVTTLWIARSFLMSSQLPAGTDMLGFVSRAAQNATLGNALSLWTPTSLGYPRTFSLDNVLGALTIVTGDPVLTVKLLAVVVMFGTGAAMYLLSWSWFRSRTVAVVAGLLYMLSQAALSRWGSGQLNVATAVAIAPILVWSWSSCLERFTIRRALGLALLVTAILLVRLDMLLYVAPFMVLYLLFALPYAGSARPLRNAVKTLAVAVPTALVINAYQILPVVLGYGPKWLSSGNLFDTQQIATHTLSAYQSLLGFGREIGYLAFTGQQTWYSFPFLPLWAYYAVASLVVVCAFLALAWQRSRRTVFLAVVAIVAVFLAKGSDPPFGGVYAWAIAHIPVVADIRDPNRWLIFEALALGPLAGITIGRLITLGPRALGHVRVPRRAGGLATRLFAAVAVAAMLLQVAPTIANGLKTWEPPANELQLLNTLRNSGNKGLVATIPYDQSTMFVDTAAYSGYEHDLGYESALFSGRPSLGTGDWDQRTSDFIAYTSTLLGSGDSAFVKLLGSIGVSNLVSLNEPIQAAQLVDAARGSYYQQTEAQSMAGLTPVSSTAGGTLYSLSGTDARITFRQNIAVVLGGRDGLAAFADIPGIDPTKWAVFDADDLVADGGMPLLLKVINASTVVVAGSAQPDEIAGLAAPAIGKVPGITSDPQVGRQTLLLPSDRSTYAGAMADPTQGIPLPETESASSSLSLRSAETVEIWAHMETSPDAADVSVSVDGRQIYDQAPLTVGSGFTWVRAGTLTLAPGTHRITVAAHRSEFGDTYEVDETRVVSSPTRAANQTVLERALTAASNRVSYALDVDAPGTYAGTPTAFEPVTSITRDPIHFWTPTAGVTASADVTDAGAPAADVIVPGDRSTYTAVQHTFPTPQDWSHRPELFLGFDGTKSGLTYQVVVTFDRGAGEAFYLVNDDVDGWHTIALSTSDPAQSDNVDWADVTGIRIALPSKATSSTFRLSALSLSDRLTSIPIAYPAPYAALTDHVAVVSSRAGGDCATGPDAATTPRLSNGTLVAALPAALLGEGCRVFVLPAAGIHELPLVVPSTSSANDQARFTSSHGGVLVFDQGYDAGWTLTAGGTSYQSLPVQSVVNGFLLPAGPHAITLSYSGNEVGMIGLGITLLALLLAGVLMWRSTSAQGAAGEARSRQMPRWLRVLLVSIVAGVVIAAVGAGLYASGSSRAQFASAVISAGAVLFLLRGRWWVPWALGLTVIAACPVVELIGDGEMLDGLATFAIALLALALLRLAFDSIPPRSMEAVQREP